MTKNYFLIWILLCCFSSAIAQNYVPIKIASGFNADVIANGVGSVTSSTTHTFDLTAFNLVSRDFVSQAGNSPLTFGLPLDGKIVASNDSNLIFQLNPYSQNNSLRLIGWGSTGDLVFETPENATKIEILTAAGNAAGSAATFSGEVRFTDNTIQSFNGLYAEDWYSYGILSPTVAYGMGRVRASDNVLEKLNDFPRLFGAQINISVSNYYKKISSIHVFKTTSTPEVLHIMAITVKKTPDCFQPTNVQVNNISTNQASISWSAATVSPNLGYEYEIRTSDLPGSGGTGLVASGSVASNTLLNDITNLVPSTVYFVYVRSKCTATSFSEWSLSKKFETKCLPPTVTVSGNSICKPGVVNLTATTTDGVLQWYDSPTSQTVLQSGGSYTTPALSATKSYWVDATSSNFISLESGKEALHTSANDVNTFVNWGVTFDLTHDVYLKSTDVFVGAPGTLNVAIYDSSGIEVFSTGDLTLSALGTLSPVTIPLNVQLKAGYGYRMLIKSFKDIKLYRDSFVAFPYKDVSEILSVSSGFFDGYTRDYYYYFYNFVFEKGCKSLRKEVVATVSNSVAPTTTLPTQTFCFESGIQLKDLRVTGSNIKWYNAATGGNQWSETALATDGTTYYASQTINGCESEDRLAITTKIEKISVFSVDQNITYNYKDVATALTATAATGNKLYWYLTATGTGENETAPVPNTSAVGVQKYWVREVSPLGCLSDAVEIIVTVNPVELTVTADPHLSKVFGATDPVFTYTATGFVGTDGNALFTGALARAAGEDVGGYAITKGTLSAGPNYSIRFISDNFTIEKATISGTTFNSQTVTYDGTAKSLVLMGLPSGASVSYTNNDQIEAGTYTVIAAIAGGVNYNNTIQTAVLTIEKATISGTTFNSQTVTYDGTTKSLVVIGLPTGTSATYTNNDQTEAGTYTVTASIAGGANYENATQTAVLTIEKAAISGTTFNDQTVTYDGTVKSLAVIGLPTGTSVTYTNNDQTETGVYTVTATISGGANYENATQTAVLTIEKASISGTTFNDQTVTYDGTTKSLVVTGLPTGTSATYTNNDQTEAGTYTVTATIAGGMNYNDTTQTAVLTIEKASISGIVFNDQTVTYDGVVKSLALTGTLPTGTSVTYTNNDQTEAGTYTVTAAIAGGVNYENAVQTAVLTIEKATISGTTFNDQTWTYDGTAKLLVVTGLPTGASVTYTNNNQTEVGIYTVTASILGGTNYIDATQTAVLTIEKATISGVVFNDKTLIYDGTVKTLALTGTLPTGTGVTYTNNDQTEVGIYTVTASITGGANFEDTTQIAVLTIEKAAISGVVFSDQTLTYDGTAKSLVVTGLPSGTSVTYTNNDQTEVGTYTVTATIVGGANYEDAIQTAVLKIEKAAISGTTFNNQTVTYDGTVKSLALTGLPIGTSVAYTNNDQTEAGTYTVTATIAGGANYENATQTAVLKIEKASISGIVFNDQTMTYDGTVKSLALSGTLPTGTGVSYTNNDQIEAGTYTVIATIAGGTNYTDATQSAVLTIKKAVISGIVFNDQTMTFDGTAKSLALTGTLPTGASVTYVNNSQTQAGTYTVKAEIKGGTNYEDSVQTAVLTIKKATISGIVLNDQTVTYDGAVKSLALTGTLPSGVTVTYTNNNQTQAGIYTVTALINGGNNYENTTKTAVLTIDKAAITSFVFSDKTVTYDGTVKSLVLTGLPTGATVSYANNNQTEAGIFTVTAQIDGGVNYISTTKTAVLTIEKANLKAIVFNGDHFVYDGFPRSLAITGTLPTGAIVSYTNNAQTNVGVYTVIAQIDGGKNYNNLTLTATLTIDKAIITGIAFSDATVPYSGTPKSLLITGSLPTGASVSYQNNGQINLGVYAVTATILGGANYSDLVLKANLTIEKGVVSNVYLPSATYTYDGTVKSLAISGNTIPAGVSVTYQNNDQIDAGIYTVTALIHGGGNYHDRELTSVLSIKKAIIDQVNFADAKVIYDGTVKALSVSGSLPAGATVTYQNNDNVDAGLYTVIADIEGGKNYAYLRLTAKLTIEKAPQIIYFEPLPVLTLEEATDFQLSATSNSKLEIKYSYTFDSSTPAAQVSESGWVTLEHPGVVLITANQSGDKNHNAAQPISRELRIESQDATIHNLWIGEQLYSNPTEQITYLIDCDNLDAEVKIKIQSQIGTTIDPGQEFVVNIFKPGVYKKVVSVTAENGKASKDYEISIVKPFPFHYIVEQKYNNVLLINNNTKTNGGFKFVKFEWYKNGQLIGEEQVYTAGNKATDLLDPKAIYSVVLTTDSGEVIPVCGSSITIKNKMGIKLYPNPVEVGDRITLTISEMQPEWKGEALQIYDMNGRLLQQTVIEGVDTEIQLSTGIQRGVYMAVFKVKGEQKAIKFVVK